MCLASWLLPGSDRRGLTLTGISHNYRQGSIVQTGFLLPHRYATFVCVVNNLYTFTLTPMQTSNGKTGNSLCLDGVKSEQVADALSPLLSTRRSTSEVSKE